MDNMSVQCDSNTLYIERNVEEILREPPSESPCLDYKQTPYKKGNRCDVIKDVIAMLNSREALGEDKWIIFGVSDDKKLLGINADKMPDDNEWRSILSKIEPEPSFLVGTVKKGLKTFGYIFISKRNTEWIYRTRETITDSNNDRPKSRKTIQQGKSYIRYGASNIPLDDKERKNLEQSVFKFRFKRLWAVIKDDLNSKNVLIALALMGSCQKGYYGDEEIISELAGLRVDVCKHFLSNVINLHREIIVFKDGAWCCTNHKELLSVIEGCIEEETIETFFKSARSVFS